MYILISDLMPGSIYRNAFLTTLFFSFFFIINEVPISPQVLVMCSIDGFVSILIAYSLALDLFIM